MDFQIGDRVELISDLAGGESNILPKGTTGIIVDISDIWPPIGVRWDEAPVRGHSCTNHCEYGYGWYVNENEITRIDIPEEPTNAPDISSLL